MDSHLVDVDPHLREVGPHHLKVVDEYRLEGMPHVKTGWAFVIHRQLVFILLTRHPLSNFYILLNRNRGLCSNSTHIGRGSLNAVVTHSNLVN